MTSTRKITLGPHETRLLFNLESRGTDIFDLHEAQEILGITGHAAADVVYRLKRKNRVVEVRKGRYLLVPAKAGEEGGWSESIFRVMDVVLERDYYVGFWAAMNYWGMTEQVPRTIHVAIQGRRRAFAFQGQQVKFVSLKPERMFGYTREPLEKGGFLVSDREKTVVDGLTMPAYCGGVGEVVKALSAARDELRWTRLGEYVRRQGADSVRRRLGFSLDLLGIGTGLRERLRGKCVGFNWLDPSAPKERLSYSQGWGIIVNIDEGELSSWRAP